MKNHASMNRLYRLVWNAALNLWVAVAENAKGRGKSGSARNKAALLMLVPLSTLMNQAGAADAANAAVVSGAGTVATSGLSTTVNQVTQKLAIDWTSLSTRVNEALIFNQPNAQAIALNRITGSSPSELLGSLTANGQVFILNPNGVLFGAGSQVNVGGLVASTLSLSNADFESGNYKFTGSGAGSVVNQGTLNAGQGGYLALLAPEVRNEGVMTASLGTALLAAGNKVTLNLDNGSLLGYSIDQGAINALAENKQLIKADGGQVLLGARALDSLTTATVNNTGIIEAKTIANKAGRIMLIGDMEHGLVNIGGTLDASAPDGGDGGFIETSAAHFKILPGAKVTTLAPHGKTGTWLLDPANVTIAGGTGGAANTFYEDALEVAGSNIVIQATDSVTVAGTFSNGDLEIAPGLNLTIQTTGTSGSGIDLTGSAHGADLNFKTSGGGNVTMTTASTSQAIKTGKITVANAGTITLNAAGTLDISGTTLQTAGGAITLTGAGSTLGDGVKISNATLNAGTGALTITGSSDAGTGVLLGTGAIVANAGNVFITGTAGGTASTAVNIASGAQVTSSGGNVTVNGTFNNPAALDGQGVRIAGKVAAPAGTVAITGSATVGGASGTGVQIETGADISAGLGATVSGGVSSATTATNLVATSMQGGTVASAGNIVMTGTVSAPSAADATGLQLAGGTVSTTGAGTISLTGSGVPAAAPASAYALNIAGATVSSAGGQINLAGDRVNILSNINAGAGRVVITPTTINRQITLAGGDESNALNLSNFELNRITAGTLVIGTTASKGGITIGNTGGAVNMVNTSSLSLLNESTDGFGVVTQSAGLTVANLNVDAADITLSNAANQISQISGHTAIGNFIVRSASALSVGTVDGRVGILSTSGGSVTLVSDGVLTQTQAVVAQGALTASSAGGMTLGHAGNQINMFSNIQNTGSGDIVLRNSIATSFYNGVSNGGGRIDINNTGHVSLNSMISSSNATNTGNTAATAAVSVLSTGRIGAGVGGGVTNSNGGSVYLQAGNGYIGANSFNRVTVSTSGGLTAVATGAASQVNLALAGGATVENASAAGAVNLNAAAGNLAVKTVSGSAVTLSAAAGAILDGNGAANNITGTTLNATAANGITLGTNVTGLQTLTTTGATGDISITAANALNTSNLNIGTNAGAAQTVSLSSAAGITVNSAFGNAQDNFKLIATGGNINVDAALQASQLTLSTTGTSAQTSAITASGLELLGTGSHTLTNAANAVTTLAGNTGNVDYAQAGALAIGTVNTAGLTGSGKVLVRTTGAASDITLNNGINAGSASNDSLVLAAGRNFVNNAGANPLNPGAGRFLVYTTNPAANTFGAMVSTGNAFGRTYAANGPADASMTSLTGNRFVYSVVPTLNVSGDSQSKVLGGADPVLTYTVNSGLVAGDTAATALGGALSALTGAATIGSTHAITQGTLASSLGYNVAYTNGTLTVTSVPVPAPAPSPSPSPPPPPPPQASSSGVPGTPGEAYVAALNNIAATDKPLGGSTGSKPAAFVGDPLANALNAAAAEAGDTSEE